MLLLMFARAGRFNSGKLLTGAVGILHDLAGCAVLLLALLHRWWAVQMVLGSIYSLQVSFFSHWST